MLLDFEVQRSTRHCAATGRPLVPGDECYAVLEVKGGEVIRKDYCREAWNGPPDKSFGWWKWHVPEAAVKKIKLAPNDVLLELFDQLAELPEQADMRYVLALLLVRRRVFRLELPSESSNDNPANDVHEGGGETVFVYCPRRDASYQIPVAMPNDERIEVIQQQLGELLVAGAQ